MLRNGAMAYFCPVKNWICLLFLMLISVPAWVQTNGLQVNDTFSTTQPQAGRFGSHSITDAGKRKWIVGGGSALVAVGSLLALNEAWYKQYPKTGFHTFDDSREWLQVDKAGHAWTAYHVSRTLTALWRWTGTPEHKAVLLGSATSIGYMGIIEYLDAHSAEWGWSWADIGANTTGTLLFAAQELAWKEQKISFKFSSAPRSYPANLQQRADKLFGKSFPEKLLKDYNAQTYWLSANIRSFYKEAPLPDWLNIAVGYGATGMFGGFENLAYDELGDPIFDRRDIARQRQWYLSPDIDFTRIKSSRKGARTLLQILNCIKMPAPALELRNGKLKGRLIAF